MQLDKAEQTVTLNSGELSVVQSYFDRHNIRVNGLGRGMDASWAVNVPGFDVQSMGPPLSADIDSTNSSEELEAAITRIEIELVSQHGLGAIDPLQRIRTFAMRLIAGGQDSPEQESAEQAKKLVLPVDVLPAVQFIAESGIDHAKITLKKAQQMEAFGIQAGKEKLNIADEETARNLLRFVSAVQEVGAAVQLEMVSLRETAESLDSEVDRVTKDLAAEE